MTTLGYTPFPPLTQRRLLSLEASPKLKNKEAEAILQILRSASKNELVTIFEQQGRSSIRTDVPGQVAFYGDWVPTPTFESRNSTFYESIRELIIATRGGEVESRSVEMLLYVAKKVHQDIEAGRLPLLTDDGDSSREFTRLSAILSILVQTFNNRYQSSEADKICRWIGNLRIDLDRIPEVEMARLQLTIARNEVELNLHRLDFDQAVGSINQMLGIQPRFLSDALTKIRNYWVTTASVVVGAIRGMDGLQLDMSSISSIWAALTASDPELRRNPLASAIHAAFDGA